MKKIVLAIAAVALVGLLILEGYRHEWTGFGPRTDPGGSLTTPRLLWDWLDLFVVPAAVAVGVFLLNDSRKRADQRIERDRQRQAVLREYVDQITQLLLGHALAGSAKPEVRSIARTRTLAALRLLDGVRKAQLLQFIYEAGLIGKAPVIDLVGADLAGAQLAEATLNQCYLRGVHFRGASFRGANFVEADLCGADLRGVDARECNFEKATLSQVRLGGARLNDARTVGARFDEVEWGRARPKPLVKQLRNQR